MPQQIQVASPKNAQIEAAIMKNLTASPGIERFPNGLLLACVALGVVVVVLDMRNNDKRLYYFMKDIALDLDKCPAAVWDVAMNPNPPGTHSDK